MVGSAGFGSPAHLASRLAGSLRPGGPAPADEAWARHWLGEGERALWETMSGPDRRHGLGVARRASAMLGGDADGTGVARPVMAAALLHDVGKIRSGLGTWGRVAATALAMTLGRRQVAAWSPRRSGWRGRAGRYLRHDVIGAALLAAAGADALTVTWAGEHHRPSALRTVDRATADALSAADGD